MNKKGHYDWSDDQPIYRQIAGILIARVIDRVYAEGEQLPSVREISDEFGVSHLTAAKVLQELDKDNIAIKRRGDKSQVRPGARNRIIKTERQQFLENEWPEIQVRLKRLEIDVSELLDALKALPE